MALRTSPEDILGQKNWGAPIKTSPIKETLASSGTAIGVPACSA
jgi:hypothetical protein